MALIWEKEIQAGAPEGKHLVKSKSALTANVWRRRRTQGGDMKNVPVREYKTLTNSEWHPRPRDFLFFFFFQTDSSRRNSDEATASWASLRMMKLKYRSLSQVSNWQVLSTRLVSSADSVQSNPRSGWRRISPWPWVNEWTDGRKAGWVTDSSVLTLVRLLCLKLQECWYRENTVFVCLHNFFFFFFPGLVNVLQLTNSPVSIPSAAWNPHHEALMAHLFLSRSFVGVFLAPTSPDINYSEASGGAKPVVTSVQVAPRFSFVSPSFLS